MHPDPTDTLLGHRFAALAGQARHYVLAGYPDMADVPALAARIESAAGRGVTVRHLVPAADVGLPGREVRLRTAALAAGLFVFDDHAALVLTDPAAEPVLLSDRGSVALLSALFERVWADALVVGDDLSDLQVTTVRLLAKGNKVRKKNN